MDEQMNQDIFAKDPVVNPPVLQPGMKFCKFCGQQISSDAVLCVHCGRQVEELSSAQASQPNIIINNSNNNVNTSRNTNRNTNVNTFVGRGRPKNKWVALLLCFFLGFLGVHKFYEGKIGMGILYLLTCGLFSIGVIIDFIRLLFKPNPYYV